MRVVNMDVLMPAARNDELTHNAMAWGRHKRDDELTLMES